METYNMGHKCNFSMGQFVSFCIKFVICLGLGVTYAALSIFTYFLYSADFEGAFLQNASSDICQTLHTT